MNQQSWTVSSNPPQESLDSLGDFGLQIGKLPSKLLLNRGITNPDAAQKYLNPKYENLSDPFDLPNMDRASDFIIGGLNSGAHFGVCGDFDVDGLTAAAILVQSLQSFGANVSTYIPNRDTEGHGFSSKAIDSLAADGASMLITADTGTTDVESVEYAKELGIRCLITDHHLPAEQLPSADAIVNPYLSENVGSPQCGSGIAFKLAQAVGRRLRQAGANDALALAALGTIADFAPLTGDNRIIVREGLRMLSRTKHPGLNALLKLAWHKTGPTPPDTELVSYQIAPRINAPGRLGNPRISLDLLTCELEAEAELIADKIEVLNTTRKRLSKNAWKIASSQISAQDHLPAVISITSKEIPAGLLGPLAARLCEEYRRPAVAINIGTDVAKGSARSTDWFDIHKALTSAKSLLTSFGGHRKAAGFTVPVNMLGELTDRLCEIAGRENYSIEAAEIQADAEVSASKLDHRLWQFVERMAPFGESNPTPLFITKGFLPTQVSNVGEGGEHLRLVLDGGGKQRFRAIGFGLGTAKLGTGLIDAIYALRTNYWKGKRQRELELKAVRTSA